MNGPIRAPASIRTPLQMAEGQDLSALGDRDAGPEHHVGADLDPGRELGIRREEHGLGRGQGDARGHGRAPQPGLQDRLGLGELGLRVDAEPGLVGTLDRGAGPAPRPGVLDRIGEVILALGLLDARARRATA